MIRGLRENRRTTRAYPKNHWSIKIDLLLRRQPHWYVEWKIRSYSQLAANCTDNDQSDLANDLTRLNYTLELNRQSILHNTLRYAPYYFYLVFLAVRLTVMLIDACHRKRRERSSSSRSLTPAWNYVKHNLLTPFDQNSTNHRVYYAYSYVSFFLDCFLGSLICLARLGGALVCSLIFSSRFDYSPCGRAVEMHDVSYMSYVSYLHMDLHRRHPVVNVFIDMIRHRLIDVRKSNLTSSLTTNDQRCEMKRLAQLARFRWALAYTLINNGMLRNSRKHRFISTSKC
jgi:hypothetical protein